VHQAPGAALGDAEEDHVERIKEGLDRARAAGRRIGRPPTAWNLEQARTLRARGLSVKHIARQMGVSRSKVMRGLGRPALAMERPAVKEDAVAKCKVGGCPKPLSMAKPSLGLCYAHLKVHPEAPPSIRTRSATVQKKRGRPGGAPASVGCCSTCGASALPAHLQQIMQELLAEGLTIGAARRVANRLGAIGQEGKP
jgi:DNA invertase Pin-like site-specific DNA recombinase